jgi:hypothetical protein
VHPLAELDPGDSGADGRDHAGRFVAKRGGKVLEGPISRRRIIPGASPAEATLTTTSRGPGSGIGISSKTRAADPRWALAASMVVISGSAHKYELASSSGEYGSAVREVSATWGSSRCDNRLM